MRLILAGLAIIVAVVAWALCKAAGDADKYFDPIDPNKPW